MQDYTTTIVVDQTPGEVFDAVNNVRGWWAGDIDGDTDRLGAEFTYRMKDIHMSKQEISEFVPNKRVAWKVVDGYLSFVDEKDEWTGTNITFDIEPRDGKTELRFTHAGLVPQFECYDNCSTSWATLVHTNLRNLIVTGEDQPSPWA